MLGQKAGCRHTEYGNWLTPEQPARNSSFQLATYGVCADYLEKEGQKFQRDHNSGIGAVCTIKEGIGGQRQ